MTDNAYDELDQLDEFEASFGDPSSVPEPISKKAKAPGPSKNQEYDPDDPPTAVRVGRPQQADSTIKTANGGKSKMGMMNTALKKMGKMTKEELENLLENLYDEELDEDYYDGDEIEYEYTPITTEDIDIEEDLDALFNTDEDLSEDFKQKASTIFEAAVVAKINEYLGEQHEIIQHEYARLKEELIEEIDPYLNHVIESWMEENHLAVEYGIRNEISESFMEGLHQLFMEHYIDVPENEIDVVEELGQRNAELQDRLNEALHEKVDMSQSLDLATKAEVFDQVAEPLTEAEKGKFASLVENIDFQDPEDFTEKLETIRESYFSQREEPVDIIYDDFEDMEPLDEEEYQPVRHTDPRVDIYAKAISRSAK